MINLSSDKCYGIMSYIGFFWLIALVCGGSSDFVKFHAGQGAALFVFQMAVVIAGGILPFLGWFLVLPVGSVMCTVFMVMGIVNAAKGTTKQLPLVSKIKLVR